MSAKKMRELEKRIAELSTQLEAIQGGKYPPPSGGYDVVAMVWARLLRVSLPAYTETIKALDRGSNALVRATWALVLATVILAGATIALVFITGKSSSNLPTAWEQKQLNIAQQTNQPDRE